MPILTPFRRVAVLVGVLAGLFVLPGAASAAVTVNSYNTFGWCCGNPLTTADEYLGWEFSVDNTTGAPLGLATLRVTFDPTQLRWDDGVDGNGTNSNLYAGYDDGAWTPAFDDAPISSTPGSCVAVTTTATSETWECDLRDAMVPDAAMGWTGVKALVPAAGFQYGMVDVDMELAFTGGVEPPHTETFQMEYQAAQSNLKVAGGHVGDPDLLDRNWVGEYRDFDGESAGTVHTAGDVVNYRFNLTNPADPSDPGTAHGVTLTFTIPIDAANGWETQLQDGDVTATGGLSNPDCVIDYDDGSEQRWICSFDGDVPVGGAAAVSVPLLFVDPVDQEFDFEFEAVNGINTTGLVSEQTYTSEPTCDLPRFFGRQSPNGGPDEFERYVMYGAAPVASLESGSPVRFQLPCDPPVPSPLTNFSSTAGLWDAAMFGYSSGNHVGIIRGPANASYGWLSNEAVPPGPNGEYAFTWENSGGITGIDPGEIVATTRVAALPVGANDYYRIMFHVTGQEQADLAANLSGASALTVGATGADLAYTATLRNDGPHAATRGRIQVQLPATAAFVSATGGSGSDACTHAGGVVTCSVTNVASGASRAFVITARFVPGTLGLALPASANATATTMLRTPWGTDSASANDMASVATSLTAPQVTTTTTNDPTCAAGEIGTPPNCIQPKVIVGGTRNATYRGTAGDDRFTGGRGSETFFGGGGSDTANGGRGDDRMYGSRESDSLYGGLGNDRLYGGEGTDLLRGDAGDDVVHGGGGLDDTRGGTGDDRVSCGAGPREKAFGNADDDVVSCLDRSGGDTVDGGHGGTDLCIGDIGDTFVGCERILRIAIPRLG